MNSLNFYKPPLNFAFVNERAFPLRRLKTISTFPPDTKFISNSNYCKSLKDLLKLFPKLSLHLSNVLELPVRF